MFKKILTTSVLGISALATMAANAAAPGIYVTGQVGYANNNMEIGINDYIKNNNLSDSSFAGRVALGYQFNPNFALETGYFRTAQKKSHFDVQDLGHGNATLDQNAVDLVAKAILPISNSFNVYGKLGVAYLRTNFCVTPDNEMVFPEKNVSRKFAPELAVGVSYDISPNVSVDTSWMHIQTLGKNRPGNVDFFSVGLGYNFG